MGDHLSKLKRVIHNGKWQFTSGTNQVMVVTAVMQLCLFLENAIKCKIDEWHEKGIEDAVSSNAK